MLTGASATLLLTLAARAAASRVAPECGFDDPWAARIARDIGAPLDAYARDPGFVRGIALRSSLIDGIVADFCMRHPEGTVVSLGAGLCTRRQRIDARLGAPSPARWVHVDLPEVMALRGRWLPPSRHEQDISGSLLEEAAWWPATAASSPLMLVAEGVCPYLPGAPLRAWFTRIGRRCEQAAAPREMVLDFIDPELLSRPTEVGAMSLPLQSAFAGVDELLALHPAMEVRAALHPFSSFSAGHAAFEAEIRRQTGRPLYTLAHIAWRTLRHDGDGPA